MKKTSTILVICLAVALIFVLVACGNVKDDVKDKMTTIKNDVTSIMDGVSSAVSDLDSSLTAEGNVTKENSSTGLLDGMASDKSTTEKGTTEKSTSSTTSGSFATTSDSANP